MNGDIECVVKQCAMYLGVPMNAAPRKSTTLWNTIQTLEVVGADVFMINGKTLFYIVDHHNNSPQ